MTKRKSIWFFYELFRPIIKIIMIWFYNNDLKIYCKIIPYSFLNIFAKSCQLDEWEFRGFFFHQIFNVYCLGMNIVVHYLRRKERENILFFIKVSTYLSFMYYMYTIFSHDIFFLGRKTPYPLLFIVYANHIKQFGETKIHGILIHLSTFRVGTMLVTGETSYVFTYVTQLWLSSTTKDIS